MLKIGDLSKIARVSIRMLRYYDQIGLLKPENVHSTTRYRSYSIDQLHRLNRILFLKDLGFSLNEINELIDSKITVVEMKKMLKKRQKDLENEIAIGQISLNMVKNRLRIIENEGEIPIYDVTIKSTEGYNVAAIRQVVPNIKDMGTYCYNMYSRLYKELGKLNISPIGPEITFYYNEEYCETDLDMEVSVILQRNTIDLDKIKDSILELKSIVPEEKVASIIYKGPFEGLEVGVIELLKWIGTNNWEVNGELREIHLSGPAHVDNEVQDGAIIELQIPIKK